MDGTTALRHVQDFLDARPSLHRPIQPVPAEEARIPTHTSFYDSHLDRLLSLQRVRIVPSLPTRLISIVNSQKDALKKSTRVPSAAGFPHSKEREKDHSAFHSSFRPSRDYLHETPDFVGKVASTIHFLHHFEKWTSIFTWKDVLESQRHPLFNDLCGLVINDSERPSSPMALLPPEIQEKIRVAKTNTPVACIFQFYDDASAGQQILDGMSRFNDDDTLLADFSPVTAGFTAPKSASFGDRENTSIVNTLIKIDEDAPTSPPPFQPQLSKKRKESKEDIAGNKKPKLSYGGVFQKVYVQATSTKIYFESEDLPRILLKHAWSQAVAANSSFIVFSCGQSERIGIRDRNAQTLYLSEVLSVYEAQEPGYFGVMTGLYLAILDDVFRRNTIRSQKLKKVLLKNSPRPTRSFQAITAGLATRDIALLSMGYACYNSTKPSIFIRRKDKESVHGTKQASYDPSEYFHVTLTSEIARGNTGIVHTATLKLISTDDAIQTMNVIVKLAMGPDQCRRLRREADTYADLSKSIKEGIPRVYGVFEDVQREITAMIMDHVGECLLTSFPDAYFDYTEDPDVPPRQRQMFKDVLSNIHAAGYLHRDIRAENLTMDDRGNVFFIDFDRARRVGHPVPEEKAQQEFEFLEQVLDGERVEPISGTSSQRERDRERSRRE